MTDQSDVDVIVQQIKAAARNLNQNIEAATANGLRVEISLDDITAMGRERQQLVSVNVLKPL